MKNYTTILSMLLRLRQSCCHCSLVKLRDPVVEPEISSTQDDFADDVSLDELLARFKDSGTQEEDVVSKYGKEVLKQIEAEQGRECPICAAEPMVLEAVTVGCWHMACKQCILQHIEVSCFQSRVLRFSSKDNEERIQFVIPVVRRFQRLRYLMSLDMRRKLMGLHRLPYKDIHLLSLLNWMP